MTDFQIPARPASIYSLVSRVDAKG